MCHVFNSLCWKYSSFNLIAFLPILPIARDTFHHPASTTMKYIVVITFIIIAGLSTAQSLGNNLREVKSLVMESADEAVSCKRDGQITWNCNCCSENCIWYVCFPDPGPMARRHPTPSSSYIAPPVFTDKDESTKGKRRPTPSSSYIAPPVFTDNNNKPAQQPTKSKAAYHG